ncbi:hypothetical protein G7069_08770 [Lysobacter sp. HDW10]|uniref:hypothetical protein n=1 Tax=Lysobacter sp. HDW10 TaxID=2714936 RepID=UPI001408ADE9|nr:hypothetical protein [Lysobacter sp. HDW10]QIK81678.1 hypothetical protein G7069_08770 [Lysobacter sp. HDW10]
MPIYDACDKPHGPVEIAYCKTRQVPGLERRTENHDMMFFCTLGKEISKANGGKGDVKKIMIYVDGKRTYGCEQLTNDKNK